MNISKRVLSDYLLSEHGTTEPRPLFEREVREMYNDFRTWYQDTYYKPVRGVTIKVFAGWLRKAGYIITTASQRIKSTL